jgi:hypothetical protein
MIVTTCPYCQGDVIILEEEINCGIFRHAVFKNGEGVPPHTPRELMKNMIELDLIFGCGSPFRLEDNKAVPCDWI